MNALSVGFPGLLKSSFTPFEYAHRSKLLEMNSGPLSTRIVCGLPRYEATHSETCTKSSVVNRWPTHRRPGSHGYGYRQTQQPESLLADQPRLETPGAD